MYLSKLGFNNTNKLLRSLLITKYLIKNTYIIPKLKKLILTLPIFDSIDLNRSKLVIIIINFLEKITNCKSIINSIKIFSKGEHFLILNVL